MLVTDFLYTETKAKANTPDSCRRFNCRTRWGGGGNVPNNSGKNKKKQWRQKTASNGHERKYQNVRLKTRTENLKEQRKSFSRFRQRKLVFLFARVAPLLDGSQHT